MRIIYEQLGANGKYIKLDEAINFLNKNIDNAKKILQYAIPEIGKLTQFSAQGALKFAILTDPKVIPEHKKKELQILIGKYIK